MLLALCSLFFASPALADGAHCWCRSEEAVCTHHTADQVVGPPATASSNITTTQCNEFCARQAEGTRNIHLDTTYIDYCTREPVECGPGGSCAGTAGSTPVPPAAGNGGAAPATPPITLFNPLGEGTDIPAFIGRGIRGVLGLVGALALLMFIWGGITWMTAGGEGKRVESAKAIIKNSIIGLLLIFFSYSLIGVFFSFFGG